MTHISSYFQLTAVLLLCYASYIQGDYGADPAPAPSYRAADPAPSYNPASAPSYNAAPAYKASPPAKDPYSTKSGLGDPIVVEDTYKEKKTTSYNKEEKEDYKKGFINDKGECMCKQSKKKNKKKTEDPGNYKADTKTDYRAASVDPAPKIEYKNPSPPASGYNPGPAPGNYNAAPAPGNYNAAPPAKY
uniref:Uncharacterized protein n=1 Tax=Cacopsylla melanoneura TaxID=428564 RepID=A0A8D8UCB8_9HEMI